MGRKVVTVMRKSPPNLRPANQNYLPEFFGFGKQTSRCRTMWITLTAKGSTRFLASPTKLTAAWSTYINFFFPPRQRGSSRTRISELDTNHLNTCQLSHNSMATSCQLLPLLLHVGRIQWRLIDIHVHEGSHSGWLPVGAFCPHCSFMKKSTADWFFFFFCALF